MPESEDSPTTRDRWGYPGGEQAGSEEGREGEASRPENPARASERSLVADEGVNEGVDKILDESSEDGS